MTIDNIMNPSRLTPAQVAAAFEIVAAVAEVIRGLGKVSSGELYARSCGTLSFANYQKILLTLKNAGLISIASHEITWIGPCLK